MAIYRLGLFGVCLLALLACTSCSGDGRKTVYPVEGKILYEGKPAPNAMISLHPMEPPPAGEEAVHPIGYADEQGNFKLTTYETNDGAPPGQYKVTIIWFKEVEERLGEQPNLLPARYANPDTSNLTVTINEGPTVLEPFSLTK